MSDKKITRRELKKKELSRKSTKNLENKRSKIIDQNINEGSSENAKSCPECGFKNIVYAKFCKNCGQEFKQVKVKQNEGICPYCAEEIKPKAVKCKHCGEWLDKKAQLPKDSDDYSGIILLGVIFTILGGIIGLIISFYLVTREDKKTHDTGLILLIINIIWIFVLLMLYSSWMSSYYYYY